VRFHPPDRSPAIAAPARCFLPLTTALENGRSLLEVRGFAVFFLKALPSDWRRRRRGRVLVRRRSV